MAAIGKKALMPNPALQPFEALIGEWQTSASHPAFPGTTFHGRTSFDWHEGGAFLVMYSEIDHPDFPAGVAIFGSDDSAETFYMLYFDERGVSRKYDVSMNGTQLKWWRDDPKFSQRFTLAIDAARNKMSGKGEMQREGGPWEADLSLNCIRAADSPDA